LINEEDKQIALAVEKVLPDVALAIESIVARLKDNGRLFTLELHERSLRRA
jgi:N-acetylmuramic acid 6-phosphate etherase